MQTRIGSGLALRPLLFAGVLGAPGCNHTDSQESPYAAASILASEASDYCELAPVAAEVLSVRPGDDEAPVDDVNWFARPVAHDGDDRIVAFASHNQNYLYNLTTGVRVQIPDRSDAVATPDGRYMTVPSNYTPDSTIRFYPVAPLLERLALGEDARDVEPAFIHDHAELTRTYYQSTAVVARDSTDDTVITTYRLMFSGTGNESQFRIVDYRFTHDRDAGTLLAVAPSLPMRLCSKVTNDLNTPFISKDGRYVAAYTSDTGERAYSPGASLKVFEILSTNPAAGSAACRQVLDLGITAGKADFSFDGTQLTFHISQGGYLTPFINGGLESNTITDIVVAQLMVDGAGNIFGHHGLRRLTTSIHGGVGSYFPAFFPDGSLFYVANTAPKDGDGAKRFHFRVVDATVGPWRSGIVEADKQGHWRLLATQWENACSARHASLNESPFPLKSHEASWLGLTLSSGQCHALVDDARADAGVGDTTDWDELAGLCQSLETDDSDRKSSRSR